MPYIPHTSEEEHLMLDAVGVSGIEELFRDIPDEFRPRSFDLPPGQSEMSVLSRIESLASKNRTDLTSFLGAGFYDHYIPAAGPALLARGEFLTAYTPYQPEASQGTLQAIFEYQTAVTRLLDLPYANASVYDGGTALYEAMMMAVRQTKKRRFVVSEGVNPIYRVMLGTYTRNLNLELVTVSHAQGRTDLEALEGALDGNTAGIIVQNPNFFGTVNDFTTLFATAAKFGVVTIMNVYPVLQAVMKTPGEMGADIAVAEGQSLGLPLSFGGPYLGIMTTSAKLLRQMPGRMVGRTEDIDGRTGYVLTLQAREQHIRREKATSNICSNQSLCALSALAYMAQLGPEGLRRTAEVSMERAHQAADRLTAIPGVCLMSDSPFGNEFAVRLPLSSFTVIDRLLGKGIIPGFPLGRYYAGLDDCLLVACTEKTTREDIGILAERMEGSLS
ncbi:MAG: aminomethyl-transferring glycine dehydrogenase subunit GcvPA [Deltaproteobacteria bacterium]|nr:aminomethyl-transferring glycine dehydrogenase subunit GcvPA [Deltaproteobacteria bacterium]